MPRCSDALGRSALEEHRAPPRVLRGLFVLIPTLPQAAYRLLVDLLWREPAFNYLTLPYWHPNGYVSLLLTADGEAENEQEEPKAG